MKTQPLEAAVLSHDAQGVAYSERFGDRYHPLAGALQQARHVFIAGHGLPQRWQGRERFVVLETGFGLGHNFLATWQAWLDDPARCTRLNFISIERHPLTRADLAAVHAGSEWPDLAQALVAQWPPALHGLHTLRFDDGAVALHLALGDVAAWLPELIARVDAFDLDGFAPARNPAMWEPRLFKAMARLAAPGATVATWTAATAVRDGLRAAGFEPRLAAGRGGKRDITLARFAPTFRPAAVPVRHSPPGDGHALVIGAGLAGCAAAWALAEQGVQVDLFERHGSVAAEASGNPGGLFHGVVHAEDGAHARWFRAAALEAAKAVRFAVDAGLAHGSAGGLLRLDDAAGGLEAMRALLTRQAVPPEWLAAVDADTGASLCGLPLPGPAWWHRQGGWVDPAGLARAFLARAGVGVRLHTSVAISRIQRTGSGWAVLDDAGRVRAEAPQLVLAGGGDALLRLVGHTAWDLEAVRGQIGILPADAARRCGLDRLRLPVSGRGYALRLGDGRLVFGATAKPGDADPNVRPADHAFNLEQLRRLFGVDAGAGSAVLEGRTGWRWTTRDRLPLVGGVPDVQAAARPGLRIDHPRFVPRVPGLYVFSAMGSRGITTAALGAQVLASQMTGAPCPVEASLLDAVDPARFISRDARRANRST